MARSGTTFGGSARSEQIARAAPPRWAALRAMGADDGDGDRGDPSHPDRQLDDLDGALAARAVAVHGEEDRQAHDLDRRRGERPGCQAAPPRDRTKDQPENEG